MTPRQLRRAALLGGLALAPLLLPTGPARAAATLGERVSLDGHDAKVAALALSPDGKWLASADADGVLLVRAVPDGKVLARREAPKTRHLAFSPDGKWLASASAGELKLWEADGWKERARAARDGLCGLAFGPEGPLTGHAEGLVFWRREGDKLVRAREVKVPRTHALAAAKSAVAVASADGELRLRRFKDGDLRVLEKVPGGPPGWLAVSGDGAWLAASGAGTALHLWDGKSGARVAGLDGPPVRSPAFAPRGALLAGATADSGLALWDASLRKPLATLGAGVGRLEAVAWSDDGRWLAAGGADGRAHLWPVGPDRCVAVLTGHGDGLHGLAFSPDGKLLATTSSVRENRVRVWDVARRSEVVLKGHRGVPVVPAWSPDGRQLAVASNDGSVRLWERDTWRLTCRIEHDGHAHTPLFSPDGRYLVTTARIGKRAAVYFWKNLPAEGGAVFWFKEEVDRFDVVGLAATGGGRLAASTYPAPGGGPGSRIFVWDVRWAQKKVVPVGGPLDWPVAGTRDLWLSGDGKVLLAGQGGSGVSRWSIDEGKALESWRVPGSETWALGHFVHPGGAWLAVVGRNPAIRLWRPGRERPALTLLGPTATGQLVAFDRTGALLAADAADGSVRVWDVRDALRP